MKILLLAPQPFYQERGTPIAIRMLLQVMAEHGAQVDVITYHEGDDITLPGVTLHRIPDGPFLRGIRPGFSVKKLLADALLFGVMLRLLARRPGYDYIHAGEEAVFMPLFLKPLLRQPYVYDMDSSLAQQMTEKFPWLRVLGRVMAFFERLAVRHAAAVVPVCDALHETIKPANPRHVVVLNDVPLLQDPTPIDEDLRADLGVGEGVLVMYVGNLEAYQGIDLLLESFAQAAAQREDLHLVIIGGNPAHIAHYQAKAAALGVGARVHLVGPRPVQQLQAYLRQADVLASPRIKGTNTPMKLYSYLDSGVPILATDLMTHTQVLDDTSGMLTAPEADAYAAGLLRLAADPALRARIGAAGKALIVEKYNYTVFQSKVVDLLEWLAANTAAPHAAG